MTTETTPALRGPLAWLLDLTLWAALAWLLASAFLYHVNISTFPYQLYLTEGGDLQSVRALQKGWDPWSPALAPEYVNLYGIGYPWLVAQVSRLAPAMNLLVLMRLVSAGAMLLTLGLLYLALREARAQALVALAVCAAVYATLLFSVDTLGARPDAMVLAMIVLCCVWTLRPSLGDALFAGALAGSAYFVKPTGLLAPVLVCALYIMQGHYRRSLAALVACLVSAATLMTLVLWRHPLYIEGTIMHQIHRRAFQWEWMLAQWQNLYVFNKPWVIALAGAGVWVLLRRKTWFPPGQWRLWAGVSALVLAALTAGPGGHPGAWLDYYNQLLLPFVFVASTLWLLAQGASQRLVALALLLNGALVLGIDKYYVPPITADQIRAWDEADAWVAQHPQGLYPPMFTSLSAKHGGFVADNDHTHGLKESYLGRHTELREALEAHNLAIGRRLAEGRFQSVVCGGNWLCPEPAALHAMGYVQVGEFHLAAIHKRGILDLAVFVPKKDRKR